MIKLVVSDIDGTLLPEGAKELNPEIYDIILELKKHNIHFAVASGRQLESQQRLFAPVADHISYISDNGAMCMHNGERFVVSEYDHDFAMHIIKEVEKRPNCNLAISTSETQYIKNGEGEFYNYLHNHLTYSITTIDSLQNIREPIIKIAFRDTVTTQDSHAHFCTLFGEKIKVAYAGNLWIDFIPFNVNKGTALKFLLGRLNLTPAEVIAFGDQQNDIEMLEYAGTSYAMAHAKPEIQAHATNTTESVVKTLRDLLKTLG